MLGGAAGAHHLRDLVDLGDDLLLFVATDRISAFDVILPTPIPGKGRVLTKLSEHWMRTTEHIISNHLTGISVAEIIGAEQALARRAATPAVAEAILRSVTVQEERAKATGLDIRTVNPVPSNIKGGISSLEEKSLGASSPIDTPSASI